MRVRLTLLCCWWRHSWTGTGRSDHGGIPAGSDGSSRKDRSLNSDARAFLDLWNKEELQVEQHEGETREREERRKRNSRFRMKIKQTGVGGKEESDNGEENNMRITSREVGTERGGN